MKKSLIFTLWLILFANIDSFAETSNSENTILEKTDSTYFKKFSPKNIGDKLADLDINLNVRFLDVDLVNGINLSSKYRYAVEPSYEDKYYTRLDRWVNEVGINTGDLLDKVSPIHFNVKKNSDIFFVRQFKSKNEALKAKPYTLRKLPINANAALRSLHPGDFVAIPATLTLDLGLNGNSTWATGPIGLEAKANASYLVTGEFIIYVFKIDEKRVRLKLMSKRTYSKELGAEANVDLTFFSANLANKAIDLLYDEKLANLYYGVQRGGQFVVDYIFDLTDTEAATAYNKILSSTFKLKELFMLNKFGGAELQDRLVSSYSMADTIFNEDNGKENPRVDRLFKGFNNFIGEKKGFKFGLFVASFKKEYTYVESNLSFVNRDNVTQTFLYPLYSDFRESKLGIRNLGLKEEVNRNYYSLIPTNVPGSEHMNPDFGMNFERKDKMFDKLEQQVIYRYIRSQIPESIIGELDLKDWTDFKWKKEVRIYYEVILKEKAFDHLKELTSKDYEIAIEDFLARQLSIIEAQGIDNLERLSHWFLITKNIRKAQIKKLATEMATIIGSDTLTSAEKAQRIAKLKENDLFEKIGPGFFATLVPREYLPESIYMKLEMFAKNYQAVKFKYGELNYKELYAQINSMQMKVSNRAFDLRLNDDAEVKTHENDETETETESF